MKKIFLFSILFILFFNLNSYSQSMYLKKGRSGLGISVGYFYNENYPSLGVGLGYSIKGIVDISIGANRAVFKEGLYDSDIQRTNWGPSLQLYALKQSKNMPFSLGAGAHYAKMSESGSEYNRLNISSKGSGYSIWIFNEKRVDSPGGTSVVPGYSITFTKSEAELKGDGHDLEETRNVTTLKIYAGISFRISPDKFFCINPSVSINKDLTTLGLSVSFIFSH